jgi:hypothetical protein
LVEVLRGDPPVPKSIDELASAGARLVTRHVLAENRKQEQTENGTEQIAEIVTAEFVEQELPGGEAEPVEQELPGGEAEPVEQELRMAEADSQGPETVVEEPEAPDPAPAQPELKVVEPPPQEDSTAPTTSEGVARISPFEDRDARRETASEWEEARTVLSKILISQASLRLEKLRVAIDQADAREIEWEARSLEKICSSLGAGSSARTFEQLSQMASAGHFGEIENELSKIEEEIRKLQENSERGSKAA